MGTDFSVSMCVYAGDRAEHFDTALQSVAAQSLLPTELVLAVDGPIPPATETVIDKYRGVFADAGVAFSLVRLEENRGHGVARRASFERCACPLIALMDADDISEKQRFEKQIAAFAADPTLSIVGGHVAEFADNDPERIVARRLVKLTDAEIKEDMKARCPMNQPTVMFKKEDVEAVGGYVDWFCNEDYYLWIRLALAGKRFCNIDACLVRMRVDGDYYKRRGGMRYFLSERRLQRLLLDEGLISPARYLLNTGKRFAVQLLLPDALRGWVFNTFARQ